MGQTFTTLCGSPCNECPSIDSSGSSVGSSTFDEEAKGGLDPTTVLGFEGQEFDRHYWMGSEIGKGAFTIVRKAKMKETGEYYAVKCTKRSEVPSGDESKDLFSEVEVMRGLQHPNIVSVFQIYREDPEYIYVVEEYMKGGELFDRIVKKTFYNEKEARDLCRILLHAIRYLHEKDIVHRDLKPENLLLSSESDDANIKVGDFGFASSVAKGQLSRPCGTPLYLAPEVIKGESYGTAVDMWATGVIIYVLLGGYMPFHDEDQRNLFRKIKSGVFKFHVEYWRRISNEAKHLIRRLLTVDAKKRITAAEAVKHPWLLTKDVDLAKRNLHINLQQLRLFNARRKLRGAINSIIFQKRLGGMVDVLD